jgi:hypothetical protein
LQHSTRTRAVDSHLHGCLLLTHKVWSQERKGIHHLAMPNEASSSLDTVLLTRVLVIGLPIVCVSMNRYKSCSTSFYIPEAPKQLYHTLLPMHGTPRSRWALLSTSCWRKGWHSQEAGHPCAKKVTYVHDTVKAPFNNQTHAWSKLLSFYLLNKQ